MKKCKNCGKPFQPINSLNRACSLGCAVKLAEKKEGKIILRQAEKQGIKDLALSLKTLGDYKKDLQIEVNKIVRLIDQDCTCISCGIGSGQFQAGHFRSCGGWDNLRFNLHNIFNQCSQCNNNKSGNPIRYRENIITLFGESQINYMDDLNVIYPSIKLNKNELTDATKTAKKIVKELTQLNKSAKLPRSTTERIYLRTKYNGELGIYS
jgi:hypothetical protein